MRFYCLIWFSDLEKKNKSFVVDEDEDLLIHEKEKQKRQSNLSKHNKSTSELVLNWLLQDNENVSPTIVNYIMDSAIAEPSSYQFLSAPVIYAYVPVPIYIDSLLMLQPQNYNLFFDPHDGAQSSSSSRRPQNVERHPVQSSNNPPFTSMLQEPGNSQVTVDARDDLDDDDQPRT